MNFKKFSELYKTFPKKISWIRDSYCPNKNELKLAELIDYEKFDELNELLLKYNLTKDLHLLGSPNSRFANMAISNDDFIDLFEKIPFLNNSDFFGNILNSYTCEGIFKNEEERRRDFYNIDSREKNNNKKIIKFIIDCCQRKLINLSSLDMDKICYSKDTIEEIKILVNKEILELSLIDKSKTKKMII